MIGKGNIDLSIPFLGLFQSILFSMKSQLLCCFILMWRNYVVHKCECVPSLTLII